MSTPKAQAAAAAEHVGTSWALKHVCRAYRRTGSLFEHPFHRVAVTTDAHFAQLVVYIHRNPQRHGLVDDFRDWPYSSYHALVSDRPTHLARDEALAWFDGRAGLQAAHVRALEEGPVAALLGDDFV